ncbi:MAG: hypothetical protein GWO07_02030 [Candidatus Dadabacteria bacterium]|nr:hypothetical protein [Candidatus Dadabacteria bacterium]NIS07548.1 hypothetical protein [Candidatus Dadabacteria bacterium]NIY21163.1 hypothetical protein [Candidatus Dadabacteria bacterium]
MIPNSFKLLLSLLLLTISCSSVDFIKSYSSLETRKNFTGQTFTKRYITYKVGKLNEGWEIVKLKYGDLAFYNKSWNSTINVNSTCSSGGNYNLATLSDSLLSGLKNKQLIKRSVATVNKEGALESRYFGQYENSKVKMSIIVYQKHLCVYDFSYISDEINFDKGYKEYKEFVSNFELIKNEQ